MKINTVILCGLFLLLTNSAFPQSGKDYLDFNSYGSLISFKKTAPDGSWIEVTTDRPGMSPYFYNLSVHYANGDLLEAYLYTSFTSKEKLYKSYVDKALSFSNAIDEIYGLASYDEEHQAYYLKTNGAVLYYSGYGDTFKVSDVLIPLGSKGDYVKCKTGSSFRYLDIDNIQDGMISVDNEIKVRKTFNDCVAELTVVPLRYNHLIAIDGEIYYNDGSFYSGKIEIPGASDTPSLWYYWRDITEKPNFVYKKGVVTTADNQYKAYEDGEYSSFETARIVQSLEKKAAEKKAEEEAIRKAKQELNREYGEKYVTAMLNGKLILGTPEELFLLGMKIHAYRSFTKADCFYTNGTRTLYNIYGWEMNPDSYVMITDSALLGMIKFENGVLVSALK